jgi:hypothetical protein
MALADVFAAIRAVTGDPREQRTLVYACAAESGCQPIAQRGGGPGMGYYQIESGQGVTASQAYDPYQATRVFYDRWPVQECVARQGQLWQSDPDTAANNAANCAEGAGSVYGASQRQSEQTIWEQAQAAGLGTTASGGTQFGLPTPGDVAGKIGDAAGGVAGRITGAIGDAAGAGVAAAFGGIWSVVSQIFSNHTFWIRVALTVGGFYAILFGVKGLAGIDAGGAAALAAAA